MSSALGTHWIWMKGPDALDFLHRLTTVNVKNMIPGEQSPGLFLTAQGKIIAAFTLVYAQKEEFAFLVQDNPKQEWQSALLKIIDQFTFAEKFALTTETDWKTEWFLDPENKIDFQDKHYFFKDGMHWVLHGSKKYGEPLVSVSGKNPVSPLPRLNPTEAEEKRILNLYPEIDQELKFDSNPLEIGLVHTIATQKGCYPGQEVIEKIISLGSPAKRLALIESKQSLSVGQTLFSEINSLKSETGTITSVSGNHALALVKKTASKEGFLFSEPAAKVEKLAPYEP